MFSDSVVLHLPNSLDLCVWDITLLEVLVKNVVKVSFANDIRPLFRPVDIEHMKGMDILLDDYKYMSSATNQYENARASTIPSRVRRSRECPRTDRIGPKTSSTYLKIG